MQLNSPTKPVYSPEFAKLVADSKLELILCGGQRVGHFTHPKIWLLRDIYEEAREEEKTRILQKLAKLARENFELKQELSKLKSKTS